MSFEDHKITNSFRWHAMGVLSMTQHNKLYIWTLNRYDREYYSMVTCLD